MSLIFYRCVQYSLSSFIQPLRRFWEWESLLVSLAFAVHGIIQKHTGKPNAYKSIFRELGVFVITLLLVILLG
ncbi:MAG: hypothetical protein ACK40V_08880, partial [Anaerolineales bacterium]